LVAVGVTVAVGVAVSVAVGVSVGVSVGVVVNTQAAITATSPSLAAIGCVSALSGGVGSGVHSFASHRGGLTGTPLSNASK
jgi:hypothetical protein